MTSDAVTDSQRAVTTKLSPLAFADTVARLTRPKEADVVGKC